MRATHTITINQDDICENNPNENFFSNITLTSGQPPIFVTRPRVRVIIDDSPQPECSKQYIYFFLRVIVNSLSTKDTDNTLLTMLGFISQGVVWKNGGEDKSVCQQQIHLAISYILWANTCIALDSQGSKVIHLALHLSIYCLNYP